jgi:adenylosuccinate synthase
MKHGKFNCIVDSAWGSSGKGAASTRLVDIYKTQNASACNYPNAGHTVIIGNDKFVAKCLPSAAILRNQGRNIKLWLGPGSGFDKAQLEKEKTQTNLDEHDLHIHSRAMIVEQRHIEAELPNGLQSTEHISSTMSGSGAAYTEKAMRKKEVKLARDYYITMEPINFVRKVRSLLYAGETFIHEVSQGFALSLSHGTHYPFCTFRDATPQQAYADFGIIPDLVGDVYLNVRSFPIRVGNNYRDGKQTGYSGDCLPDQHELTWEQIGTEAEMPIDEISKLAEKERTTVTKKIRRCFSPSWELLKDSAMFCGATKMILNFPQYLHWSAYKIKGGREQLDKLHNNVRSYIDKMQEATNLPVTLIGTGPEHHDFINLE